MNRIAAIQMNSSHIVADNLMHASRLIAQAVATGAKLVVLPEMFAVMGKTATDKVTVKERFSHGPIQEFLSNQAKTHGIWLIGGTIPIACEHSNKIKAACLVHNDQGQLVARYDKIHLYDVDLGTEVHKESATTEYGDKIVTIDTPFGKIGLTVCYDIRFGSLFNALYRQHVDIITIPAAFTIPTGEAHWEALMRARAIEGFCYTIGACQTGTHSSGRKTYGHSLIVGPWGNIESQLPDSEGVITVDIDLAKIQEIRRKIPVHQHQRI